MNEENSNQSVVNNNPEATQPTQTPVQEPVVTQPTPEPVQEPVVAPVQEAAPAPVETPAQPVQEATPTPVEAPAQPVQEATPTPVPEVAAVQTAQQPQVAQPTPVAEPQVAPQQETVPTVDGTTVVTETNANSGINSLNSIGVQDVSGVGFVASGEVVKKKTSKGVIATIVVLIVVLLGLLGYFVIFPWIVKTYLTDPKRVYEVAINEVAKKLNDSVDDVLKEKMIYDVSFSIDTNMAQYTQYSSYTYGVNVGVDPNKKLIQSGFYVINPAGNEKSYYSYLRDGTQYEKLSNHPNLIYDGKAKMDSEEAIVSFQEILNTFNRAKGDDTKYIIDKFSNLLIESIDESKLTKEDASINIKGNNVKVLANKYTMDSDNIKRTIQFIANGLLEDEKSLDIISTMAGSEKAEIRANLENMKQNGGFESDDEITEFDFIIYTYGVKNEGVGFAIQTKDNGSLHYYNKDNYEELVINYKENSLDQGEKDETIKVIGNKANGATKYDVTKGDTKIAEFVVRSLEKNKIDIDYTFIDEKNGTYTGSFKYDDDRNETRSKAVIEFSMKVNEDRFNIKANINQDWTSEVANINTKAAETLDDSTKEQLFTSFLQSIAETPVGEMLKTESGEFDPSIAKYYIQNGFKQSEDNSELFNKACMNLIDGNYSSTEINCSNYICTYKENNQTISKACY